MRKDIGGMDGKMGTDDGKPNVDNMIDTNLRKVYESVLQEDVPDRFAKLLDQLRSGEPSAASEGAANASGDAEGDVR
jgi:hypothetical protein